MDLFDRGLEEHNNRFSDVFILAKVCAPETNHEFARQLVSFRRPASFNCAAKFRITEAQRYAPAVIRTKPATKMDNPTFDQCRTSVETEVVKFCLAYEGWLGGKILCRTRQSATMGRISKPVVTPEITEPSCQDCYAPLDAKVVAFYRIDGRRFGRKVLCRTYQTKIAVTVG